MGAMPGLCELLCAELTRETEATRRVLQRVPEAKFSWKPHPRSLSIGQLAMHVAVLPRGIASLLSELVSGLPNVPRPEATSGGELMSALDDSVAFATGRLREWGDDGLAAQWKLVSGGRTLFDLPRGQVFRSIMLNHWYHHRGQLTVYLRLLDVPVPSIYGPTADENPLA
jgi:uncharacterized damage-inducible protein DinB